MRQHIARIYLNGSEAITFRPGPVPLIKELNCCPCVPSFSQRRIGGLDIIRRLRPISFNWKEGGQPDIGLGAEDVAKVAPSFTFTNNRGEVTGVKYERLDLLLINAVKEQQQQLEQQRQQIAQLEGQVRQLRAAVHRRRVKR